MKKMKKFASLLLALVLVFSLAATAFAQDITEPTKNDSITVNSAKSGETYNLYKLFDLVVNDEITPTAYSYKVNSDWSAFFAEGGAGKQYITVNDEGYVTAISDAAALAKAAAAWTGKPAVTQTATAASETVTFSGLENGYWLITSSLGTVAMTETTPDKATVSVNEKNPEDTISKEVQEDSNSSWGNSNDAQIGDTVKFQSTITLVPGTRNVVVHDTMDDGLTLNADSIAIAGLTKGTDYTVTTTCNDGCTFEIDFKDTYVDGLTASTTLTLTYSAVLNEKAIVTTETTTGEGEETVTTKTTAIDPQTNTIVLNFGDAQSVTATTTTTTHKFSVFKHAKDSTTNLAGAVFSLKKGGIVVNLIKIDDTNYRVAKTGETGVATFTTVAAGDIVIWGVDADADYTLEEKEAPEGYNRLTSEVTVTVNAGNASRIDVENKTGTELPSTGGMGTTLFYTLGSILVVAAVVLLVTKKRMTSAQ